MTTDPGIKQRIDIHSGIQLLGATAAGYRELSDPNGMESGDVAGRAR